MNLFFILPEADQKETYIFEKNYTESENNVFTSCNFSNDWKKIHLGPDPSAIKDISKKRLSI